MSANLCCFECCASLSSSKDSRVKQDKAPLSELDTKREHARLQVRAVERADNGEESSEMLDDEVEHSNRSSESGDVELTSETNSQSDVDNQRDYSDVYLEQFLDYPKPRAIISKPVVALSEWTEESVCFLIDTSVRTKDAWNGTFNKLVQSNCVKDLELRIHPKSTQDASPDFATLLQCPLSTVSIHVSSDHYCLPIPDSLMTALKMKSELEVMSLSEPNCSANLTTLLDYQFLPRLRYLDLSIERLDLCIDFSKIPQLTVLRLRSLYASFEGSLNLEPLTKLKALDIGLRNTFLAGREPVCDLGQVRTQLWWLCVLSGAEIKGNLSTVTHLGLRFFYDDSNLQQVVSACSQLTQLSVYNSRVNSLAIPNGVNRLILNDCSFGRLEIPENKTFDVLFLKNVTMTIVPPRLQATHICIAFTSDERQYGSLEFVRNLIANPSVLGSPKSLALISNACPPPEDVLDSLMKHDSIRRLLEFFATNLPLTKPLLAMTRIRALCLGRFADIRFIEALGYSKPLAELIIAGEPEPPIRWEDLHLPEVTESLLVPVDQEIPGSLGIQVYKSLRRPHCQSVEDAYSCHWAFHVCQLTESKLVIQYQDLCLA